LRVLALFRDEMAAGLAALRREAVPGTALIAVYCAEISMEWHDIHDPNEAELDRLAERYGLHPLHIEDCRHRGQNAKVEESGDYLFVVLKPVALESGGELAFSDLDLFVGRDFLITVEEGSCPPARQILDRVRAGYQELIAAEPARWVVVDASRPPEVVAADLQKAVLSRIKER